MVELPDQIESESKDVFSAEENGPDGCGYGYCPDRSHEGIPRNVLKVTACGFSGDAGWVLSGSHGKVSGSASLAIGSIQRTDVVFIPVNIPLP